MTHISCDTCERYQPRHLDPEAQAKADAAGHPVSPGFCTRYPLLLPKQPHQVCGEHSVLERQRMRTLADMIAAALLPNDDPPPRLKAVA